MMHYWWSPFAVLFSLTAISAIAPPADFIGRRVEDVDNNYNFEGGDYEYDISDYSIRFGKCQYVKMYDDEIAQDEDYDSVFAFKQFIVYRLCPTDDCDSCQKNYGEYVADVEDYLESTVESQKEQFENMCDNCSEKCNDSGEYCSGCGKLCYQYDNLEANGYVDASDYIECQEFNLGGDDDDLELYIGPRCSSDGNQIKIGLFTDENCWEPYLDEDVEDLVGMKFSYHFLASTYSGSVCLSCMEGSSDDNEVDDQDGDNVSEMCENIYALSAKCESKHGIDNGFIQQNLDDYEFENQVANEYDVCTFIDSLVFNSYTESGEINYQAVQDEIIIVGSPFQKSLLSLLSLSIVGLFAYAAFLHKKIVLQSPVGDALTPS